MGGGEQKCPSPAAARSMQWVDGVREQEGGKRPEADRDAAAAQRDSIVASARVEVVLGRSALRYPTAAGFTCISVRLYSVARHDSLNAQCIRVTSRSFWYSIA